MSIFRYDSKDYSPKLNFQTTKYLRVFIRQSLFHMKNVILEVYTFPS